MSQYFTGIRAAGLEAARRIQLGPDASTLRLLSRSSAGAYSQLTTTTSWNIEAAVGSPTLLHLTETDSLKSLSMQRLAGVAFLSQGTSTWYVWRMSRPVAVPVGANHREWVFQIDLTGDTFTPA
jgi:hypothetical protein